MTPQIQERRAVLASAAKPKLEPLRREFRPGRRSFTGLTFLAVGGAMAHSVLASPVPVLTGAFLGLVLYTLWWSEPGWPSGIFGEPPTLPSPVLPPVPASSDLNLNEVTLPWWAADSSYRF